jgi:hypothetical protein
VSLPATTRSGTLVQQALISGSVKDTLTQRAPRGALTVQLLDRDTGDGYPLAGRTRPDGCFAFYGSPKTAFPRLAEHTYHLRVEATAPNYQPTWADLDLGPIADQPTLATRPVPLDNIPDMQVWLFTGDGLPLTDIDLGLDRNPVRLHGRVVSLPEPDQQDDNTGGSPPSLTGVQDATVEIDPPTGPATTTDADGRFEFPAPLPITLSVEIKVSATDFEEKMLTYEPDYTQPVNTLSIRLKRSHGGSG